MSAERETNQSGAQSSDGLQQPDKNTAAGVNAALQHVLEQVLAVTETDANRSSGESAVCGELIEVARQHSDQQFGLDPAMLSLVEVITNRIQPLSDSQRNRMRLSVAQTLFDDVSSRMRIERLWEQLKRLSTDAE